MAAHSPYLSQLAAQGLLPDHPPLPQDAMDWLQDQAASQGNGDRDAIMSRLRHLKRQAAGIAAAGDLSGIWHDQDVMRFLSALADACIRSALVCLLLEAQAGGHLRLSKGTETADATGICIVALGKWGAHELNYSSDIDLILIFDPARIKGMRADGAQSFCNRLARDLAQMMETPTAEGYVFRTDLRLRPDPGAMPLAISLQTAETYYGSLGQNWERAAMIKARVVAGDSSIADDFRRLMQSWIWRKNLDFAAIQDIHSIKRQIDARQKPARNAASPFAGYNVKLGHGGIREIEFFAQTQQLIFGGREPDLRQPATLAALQALHDRGHIAAAALSRLKDSYLFLRRIEHRLQMQDDLQTHSLPATPRDFAGFAKFAGYESAHALIADLKKHTAFVRKTYAALFAESPGLGHDGSLVFTGIEDDPETLQTLNRMGFALPSQVTASVRGWHHARYRATRSERARQILTEITPRLLRELAATPQPDDAFLRFDRFLSRLPSGVAIFSMFARRPEQIRTLATVMGSAPALADEIAAHPQMLDGVLSRDFFGRLPALPWLIADLEKQLSQARDYQDKLDMARRWARERRFHAALCLLQNRADNRRIGQYHADIAEAVLGVLVPAVEQDFATLHGHITDGSFLLLGLGSLGARNMFADSDLDLVALYDAPEETTSDGNKPLGATAYYIRLTQRIVTALTAPTAEGILYNADLRLRPSGNDGPLAVSLDGFLSYQRDKAWTWEHMSLLRARVVQGPAEARRKITAGIRRIIRQPRDRQQLKKDVLSMRRTIAASHPGKDRWDLKYRRGGLMDIMFTVQYLALRDGVPVQGSLDAAFDKLLKQDAITKKDHRALQAAWETMTGLQHILRLTAGLNFRPAIASEALKTGLTRRIFGPKTTRRFRDLEKHLDDLCRSSAEIFKKYI